MAKGEIRYSRETSYNMGLPFCDTLIYRVKGRRRAARALGRPTSDAQVAINQRNARMTFARLANANFSDGRDVFITLSFDDAHKPRTRAEAKALTGNFLRRVKRAFARICPDRTFKWLYVIEGGDQQRIHIHMLMSGGLPQAKLRALWGMSSIVNVKTLQASDRGFEALAGYLTKQGRLAGEHRWYASRRLDKPSYDELHMGISAEETESLARAIEDINAGSDTDRRTTAERYAPVEDRYPAYYLAEAEAMFIERFREWVLHIKLYRRDSAPGLREAKRRRAEERAQKLAQRMTRLGNGGV